MKIVKIDYPTPLELIEGTQCDNVDVFVQLDDGITYTVVVATAKSLEKYMENEKLNYLPPAPPEIIVRNLDEYTIREALEAYAKDNAFWLKLYFLLGVDKTFINLKDLEARLLEVKKFNENL